MAEEKLEPMFLSKEDVDLFAAEMCFKGMDPHLDRLAHKMAVNTVATYIFRDQRRYDLCEEQLRFNHRMLFPSLSDKDVERALELLAEHQSHIDTLLDLGAMTGPDASSQLENDPRWETARKSAIQYALAVGMKTNDAMQYAVAMVEAGKALIGKARFAEKRQLLAAEEIFLRTLLGGMDNDSVRRQSNLSVRSIEDYRLFTKQGLVRSLDDSAEYYYALLYSMKYPGARAQTGSKRGCSDGLKRLGSI
jgi:hypothetical protein